jgi:hypothetical protein
MLIVFTGLAFFFLGRELSLRWWRDDPPAFYERTTYAAVIGFLIWLASLWLLALIHLMTPVALIARSVIALAAAVTLKVRRDTPAPAGFWSERALWLVVIPWVLFAAWRGWLLPPVNHDALAYHLPKAVLFSRAAGYEHLSYLDARIANIPANYEMLLAETIVLQGRDTITEWFSTLFFVLFAIASAAVAERFMECGGRSRRSAVDGKSGGYGRRTPDDEPQSVRGRPTIVALLTAGVPVVLLHSGAHKNDLMTATLIVAGLVAAGRFISTGEQRTLLLTVATFAAAVGTKPQAAIVALCLAPVILWRARVRELGLAAAAGLMFFLLLGGAVYISNFVAARAVIGSQASGEAVIQYGDWSNLWQAPYVLLAAPFARDATSLWVPWETRPWFWRRYEVFFSHLGIPFAICAIAAPLIVVALRRRVSKEMIIISAVAVVALAVMLPVDFQPHGLYAISLPRYALFIVPIVFAWTVGALSHRLYGVTAGIGAIAFSFYAVDAARNDVFAPWAYVQWVREHPETRAVSFDPWRAAEVADRRAGPRDRIAFDAAFGSWIHPAFGVELSRPVDFIPMSAGPPQIREDAKWVVIDRGWAMVWQNPAFRDLSQARDFLLRGGPAAGDERVFRLLQGDPRFKLVFYNPKTFQAVFQRVQ